VQLYETGEGEQEAQLLVTASEQAAVGLDEPALV
jgi:hypothetical protein